MAYRGMLRFAQPLAPFNSIHTEKAFRYLLSCAASFHGGLAWAADCLDDYTPNEIQAALLLCPSPCRPDWPECPMTELMVAYAGEWYMLDYNPAERLFFGWANLLGEDMYWELGSVGLDEMEDLAITVTPARVGLPLTEKQYTCRVTLDRNFIETPISRIRELPPRCAQLHTSAAAGL